MTYKEIIDKTAEKFNLPEEVIKLAYESYWEFIRMTIKELPLKEELLESDFSQLRTNFNIPTLGKLTCTYGRYLGVNKKYEILKSLKKDENKEA